MRTFAQEQQPQKAVSSSLDQPDVTTPQQAHREHPILNLQSTVGNQAVLRMLQAHTEEPGVGSTAAASPRFGDDFSPTPMHSLAEGVMQTKLTINTPGDEYEQEADRVADQVMATPAHHAVSGAPLNIQRFAGQSTGQMDAAPASVGEALAGPGRPLEPPLRQDMEERFGHDFSQVRVHSGAAAERSAQDVHANAYTVGHDIVFGADQPEPGSREGRKLLAHELTHVVQQRAGHAQGMQRDSKVSEGVPNKARVIKLGELRYQYDFGRPITREQAVQVLFVDGKVPDEARLVQGPGGHSWTLQTFDLEGQQATVNRMRARTETVSPGKPSAPPVPGQWSPPPPHEITVEWADGPSKPGAGPRRRDLKNDLGFKITRNYRLDEGQSPVRHVRSGFGLGKGHGYELAFEKPMTRDQVMDTLFGKNDLGEGTVKLFPVPSEPTTIWQAHVIGVDALTAFKHPVLGAIADANTEAEESIAPDVPSGIRAYIEKKQVPKDAVEHPPDVFVWEQEGYLVRVETDGKGENGYYTYETTRLDHADESSKITMRYFMIELGMRPREAWQEYIKHWDEIHLQMLGMVSLGRLPGRAPRARMPIKTSTPAPPVKSRPVPAPTVKQGGGQGTGKPTGMLRDTDASSRGVQVDTSHPVFKNKQPANDAQPPPRDQAAKVAVNATKDLPRGQTIDPVQGAGATGQNTNPTRMGKKPPTSDSKLKKNSGPPAAELDPGEGATTKKPRRSRGDGDDLPSKQKISDRYDKPELEQSPELIARLPDPNHRRLYMEWLKKGHLGTGHPHVNPAKDLDASLEQFSAESGVRLVPKK
ncbi:MAG TPA: DUF4157 domain-containing protein [Blastocatellia bacterium]|nr:DUF4157 domain-containing protein [Blastocatellia bacterium]